MREPVIDTYGHSFEREAIEAALREKPGVCPITNARYPDGEARLTPNRVVRDLISDFQLERKGEASLQRGFKAKVLRALRACG
eukprot:CAMPEP_0118937602 /NCGR_PEP_ID=MMETSP1169-20130426/23245_1 /TAXON_ID=36882 /ORGANISM="Pyramimonas obovata, Strain CCMP722" /LENGTH=82 /DNA_ID=CAMNT_0006881283 /DNA_START=38 /DNA_END=282 /DNA_ORIENTATION=+